MKFDAAHWERAAIHEAGHALLYVVAGLGAEGIYIGESTLTVEGLTVLGNRKPMDRTPWQYLICCFAGASAEAIMYEIVEDRWRFNGDLQLAELAVRTLTSDPSRLANPPVMCPECIPDVQSCIASGAPYEQQFERLCLLAQNCATSLLVDRTEAIVEITDQLMKQPVEPADWPDGQHFEFSRVLLEPLK